MASELSRLLSKWRRDPVAFITEVLRDPETGRPFELYPAQERFLRAGFTPGRDGRLPFTELVYSCPQKAGKAASGAMAVLCRDRMPGRPLRRGYCVANDFEQAQGRVFQQIARIIEA